MTQDLEENKKSDEISALVGELPSWSARKLGFQIFLLATLIILIIFLTSKNRDDGFSRLDIKPVIVATNGPVLEYLGNRYQFGRPGDMVVIRVCNGLSLPWLLRASTGELYRFDSWAKERNVETSPIRNIEGATGLSVVKDPVCDQLVIDRSNADPLTLAN